MSAARHRGLLLVLVLAIAGLAELGIYYWPHRLLFTARAALTRHQYDMARAALVSFLEARPNHAEAHLLLARLDRRANRHADAAAHLDSCQRLGGPAEAIALDRMPMSTSFWKPSARASARRTA